MDDCGISSAEFFNSITKELFYNVVCAEKRRSLGRYSSLADSDHGVFFCDYYRFHITAKIIVPYVISLNTFPVHQYIFG
jgi:hypothetical protein